MVDHLLQGCLYFTANSLARSLTSMAEEEFRKTGFAPNYAFIIMLVCEKPGMMQKELGAYLQLTPSTITRFVDKLERNHMVVRTGEGKAVFLEATAEGRAMLPEIQAAWDRLYQRYSKIIGQKKGDKLTKQLWQATLKLEHL